MDGIYVTVISNKVHISERDVSRMEIDMRNLYFIFQY